MKLSVENLDTITTIIKPDGTNVHVVMIERSGCPVNDPNIHYWDGSELNCESLSSMSGCEAYNT